MAEVLSSADFILRLDDASFGHQLLPVDHFEAFALQRKQNRQFDDVDADRLFVQAAHFEFKANLFRDVFGAAHLRRHCAAQH